MKSKDYVAGFTAALVFVSDLFEQRSKTLMKKRILRLKDIKFISAVLDACIRRREVLMDVGPKGVNLFLRKDGHVDLKEK